MTYRPHIDGLRAFAILAVVLYHAFPGWLSGGFIGVDVFFVVSGYLISYMMYKDFDQGRFHFLDFYGRRIRRLFPALALVLISALLAGWFLLLADEYTQLGKHTAGGATFSSNMMFWLERAEYFDNEAETKPLLHLWSLAIEEQFYIFLPLFLWVIYRLQLPLFSLLLLAMLASLSLSIFYSDTKPVAMFFLPFGRIWELLAGSILAWLWVYKPNSLVVFSQPKVANTLTLLSLLTLVSGAVYLHEGLNFPGFWALIPVLSTVLLITTGREARLSTAVMENPLMIWLGRISYPLYLWHWPMLSFLVIIEGKQPGMDLRLLAVFTSIMLAHWTYVLIEKPARQLKATSIPVLALFLLVLGIGSLGYVVYAKDGFGNRQANSKYLAFEPYTSRPGPANQMRYAPYKTCAEYLPEIELKRRLECLVLQDQTPDILFIGDSHTGQYALSLVEQKGNRHLGIVQMGSCLPFRSSDDSRLYREFCEPAMDEVLDFLKKDQHIKTIVLSAFWSKAISGKLGEQGPNWRLAGMADEKDLQSFSTNMKRFVEVALNGDRQLVFMHDIPRLNFNIRHCFDLRHFRFTAIDNLEGCSMKKREYDAIDQPFRDFLNEQLSHYPGIHVYEPARVLCDEHRCYAKEDGRPLYYNGDHLNEYGAEKVLKDFIGLGYLD